MHSQSVLTQFSIFMTYLFFAFIIPDLILIANWLIKVMLIASYVWVIKKLFDTINHIVNIPTFQQQLYETNQTIKITCVFTFYSISYFFVSYF
jgi:hypothetical protein